MTWKVVHDGPSLAMLMRPDGRIYRLQELAGQGWTAPGDNDQLCEQVCSALSETAPPLECTLEIRQHLEGRTGTDFLAHWKELAKQWQRTEMEPSKEELVKAALQEWHHGQLPAVTALWAIYSMFFHGVPNEDDMKWAMETIQERAANARR